MSKSILTAIADAILAESDCDNGPEVIPFSSLSRKVMGKLQRHLYGDGQPQLTPYQKAHLRKLGEIAY